MVLSDGIVRTEGIACSENVHARFMSGRYGDQVLYDGNVVGLVKGRRAYVGASVIVCCFTRHTIEFCHK